MGIDAKAQREDVPKKAIQKRRAAVDYRRMHLYVTEAANKIVRSECQKRGITITDYVVSSALSFRADEASKKLDITLQKLKRYMNKKGIKDDARAATKRPTATGSCCSCSRGTAGMLCGREQQAGRRSPKAAGIKYSQRRCKNGKKQCKH